MLQSLLHLRIHAALQEIEHSGAALDRSAVLREKEHLQNKHESAKNEDSAGSENEDNFFDAEEDFVPDLCRHDSNSSFDIISDFCEEV